MFLRHAVAADATAGETETCVVKRSNADELPTEIVKVPACACVRVSKCVRVRVCV